MIELARADYGSAEPLFADYPHMRHAIWTVFEGRQAGSVFVDDPHTPGAAVVWNQDCYLGGAPRAGAFAAEVAELVRTRTRESGHGAFIFATDAGWLEIMAALLAEDGVHRLVRSTFRFDAELWAARHADWRARVTPECRVVPLDAQLADYPGIYSLWGSIERFLALGFGYAVLVDGVRVTKAQSVFIGDGLVEIGIDTLPPYQRRGYARLAACACIEHALRIGLTPGWGAYDNPPSVALAQQLGFVQLADWPLLCVPAPHDEA